MKFRFALGATLVLALAASAASGADKKKAAGPPDEKAMMEMMMKAATPGEQHKKLDSMVGTWDTKVKSWMDPSKPPQESTGVSENKWVLGNRYMEQRFEGTFMGQPFSGIGYTGYDNVTKKYFGTWMDTASTGVMTSTGSADPSGKVMTFTATMADPMTGKNSRFTNKVIVADNDHHTMEMWGAGPSGKNYKMMEITYSRKK